MADKEEIRARNDIVEVIGAFVPLKHRGRNWIGLCPFHQEKTPSFNVTPQTQSFKCFGCSLAGDVFSFIEKYENMTFVEAAEFLARRVGLTFDRKGGAEAQVATSEREQLYAVNAEALRYFRRMLEKARTASDYLYGRGLAHDTIQRFQLGYAPEGWDNLTGYLQRQKVDLALAAKAGLVQVGKSGDYYDMFRHRVLFPIHDEQERIVGFGGRAFGDDPPKYLNTGETPIFNKSRLLYGLPFARRKIASEGRTLLMEGYMDVIAAHQAGFTNAVATLGTSLTEEHARKLARLTPDNPVVVLVYDADNAGIKATLRASEILEKESVEVRVVRLPAGDDPDSLLKRGEVARFQKAVDEAVGRVEYQLERIVAKADQSTDAGRAKMLHQIIAILATVRTRAERDVYVDRMWRHHPLSASSPDLAKEQLHRDAETYAAGKGFDRRAAMRPAADTAAEGAAAPGAPSAPAAQPAQSGHQPQRRNWTREERAEFERRQFLRSVRPVQTAGSAPTGVERAEGELIRALWEPEWRATVLRGISADELPSETGRAFYRLVEANLPALQQDEGALARLLNATADVADESGETGEVGMAMRDRVQEVQARPANEPITAELIAQCAATVRRAHKERRIAALSEELGALLQKPALSQDDLARVAEFQRMLKDLKGAAE